MSNYRTTISADSAGTAIAYVKSPDGLVGWISTVNAYGTFGGGTLSYALSTDGGSTLVPCKDLSGVAYSTTTADTISIGPLGANDHNNANQQVILYAVLTGATNPSITIDVEDNA